MTFSRALRRRLSGWLAMAILFMQLATAAYACPANAANRAPGEMAAAAMAGMPCAEAMAQGTALDAEQPGLCQQHCQFGHTQQPSDPWPLLQAPAATPLLLFVLAPAALPAVAPGWAQRARARTHERAPPLAHSILHCCFRI